MQMRSRRPPGGANMAHNGALLDGLAGLYVDLTHMTINRDQALAMVQIRDIAVEEKITGCQHSRVRWRANWGALGRGDIQTSMWTARLVVIKSTQTVTAADRSLDWAYKAKVRHFVAPCRKCFFGNVLFPVDPLKI